jgi:vanillate O-demethylase ferredoxin subunit
MNGAFDSFFVKAARSGVTVEVPADRSIAEVLIENGVEVPTCCEQGVCGTCLTDVLEGIPDHRDQFQTDREKATNEQMTLCCSRSFSPLLVLDI